MENFRHLEHVATLTLKSELCVGCSLCTQVCPQQVLEMMGNTVVIADPDACMECGACVNNCPTGALAVNPGVG